MLYRAKAYTPSPLKYPSRGGGCTQRGGALKIPAAGGFRMYTPSTMPSGQNRGGEGSCIIFLGATNINFLLPPLAGLSSQGRIPPVPFVPRFAPGTGPVCPRDGSCLSRTPWHPKCSCLLVFLAQWFQFDFNSQSVCEVSHRSKVNECFKFNSDRANWVRRSHFHFAWVSPPRFVKRFSVRKRFCCELGSQRI